MLSDEFWKQVQPNAYVLEQELFIDRTDGERDMCLHYDIGIVRC